MTGVDAENCAVCGKSDVYSTKSLPVDWENYLRETRDWTPIMSKRVPLCHSCVSEYDQLKSGDYTPVPSDDERVQSVLDELSLDELVNSQ